MTDTCGCAQHNSLKFAIQALTSPQQGRRATIHHLHKPLNQMCKISEIVSRSNDYG
jgi:hypothetical protein